MFSAKSVLSVLVSAAVSLGLAVGANPEARQVVQHYLSQSDVIARQAMAELSHSTATVANSLALQMGLPDNTASVGLDGQISVQAPQLAPPSLVIEQPAVPDIPLGGDANAEVDAQAGVDITVQTGPVQVAPSLNTQLNANGKGGLGGLLSGFKLGFGASNNTQATANK